MEGRVPLPRISLGFPATTRSSQQTLTVPTSPYPASLSTYIHQVVQYCLYISNSDLFLVPLLPRTINHNSRSTTIMKVGKCGADLSITLTYNQQPHTDSSVYSVVAGAAGGIGQPLSLLLKACPLVDKLALYDVVNTPGVAADLSHISSIAVRNIRKYM